MSSILSVPYRSQQADGYCLPACVQMVLAYWGIEREQEDVAKQLDLIAGAGVPGNRVRRLASDRLDIIYGQDELVDLQRALVDSIPPIVLVYTGELPYWDQETAHAVVMLGLDANTAMISDPAMGQDVIEVSWGDLELAWDEMANLYALLRHN